MKRLGFLLLAFCTLLFLTGCPYDEKGQHPSEVGKTDRYTNKKDQLVGTWLLTDYKGLDNKWQQVSNDGGGTTYTFSEDKVKLHWKDGIEQDGTYEWYYRDDGRLFSGIDTITLHFESAASEDGDTQASTADIHFAVNFEGSDKAAPLRFRVQETGEEMLLRRQ